MDNDAKDLSKISNNEILTFEAGLVKMGVVSPHQVQTDNIKLKYALEHMDSDDEIIDTLNERNIRLGQQIAEAGCVIEDAMALNFVVRNVRAENIENNVREVLSLLRINGVSAELVQSVEKLLIKGDI